MADRSPYRQIWVYKPTPYASPPAGRQNSSLLASLPPVSRADVRGLTILPRAFALGFMLLPACAGWG
ncbi:MAG TPA: hypothetical protein VLR90_16280 [Blastocatellia bacterium]|nr:hypothetical protein [Blastocatellia bacterium]